MKKMKVTFEKFHCQNCGKSHRSYVAAGRYQWGNKYLKHFVTDEGPFATLHAGKFRLHRSRAAAQNFLRALIDGKLGLFFANTDPLILWEFSHQEGKWISSDAFNKVVSNGKIIFQTMWSRYSH